MENKSACSVVCLDVHSLRVWLYNYPEIFFSVFQVFTYFMHTKPQSWKDKYVAGYVALSAPLAGAAKLFRLYASGELFCAVIWSFQVPLSSEVGLQSFYLIIITLLFPVGIFIIYCEYIAVVKKSILVVQIHK